VNPVTNYHEMGCQIYCDSSRHTQRGADGKIIRHTGVHTGMDIGGPLGTPIYAAISGMVEEGPSDGSYGKYLTVTSVDGKTSTLYAHLSKTIVRSGYVSAGTRIAEMGSTGNSSASHLHFEVRINGDEKDPRAFLNYSV